jgi:iron complex transport system substrate-binding protein
MRRSGTMRGTVRRPEGRTRIGPEVVYGVTRREFLIGAGSVLVFGAVGCGGEAGESASGETRIIRHSFGESEVPARPQRVVAVDPYLTLPTAALLDVPVVGTAYIPAGEPFPPFLDEEDLSGVEDVGWMEMNLEQVAALEPDLIIGMETFLETVYEELSRIAPAVAVSYEPPDWKGHVRAVAEAFGERAAADRHIADFEGRVEGFRRAMGDRLDELEVSLVNIREAQDIRIYTEKDIAGSILKEAGLRRPEDQRAAEDPDAINIRLSLELLPRIDADVIFYYVGSAGGDYEESEAELAGIQENRLWQQLEAVRSGRAYRVDAAHWFGTGSVQAANLVLDDLERYLLE